MSARVYLVGLMGSGKSFMAPIMAEVLRIPVIDTDLYIEQKKGLTVSEIFANFGEVFFRNLEREALHEISEKYSSAVISTGGGLPCFHENMEYMNEDGLTIFINPPINTLFERLRTSTHRPLLQDKNDDELYAYIQQTKINRLPFYQKAQWEINPATIR